MQRGQRLRVGKGKADSNSRPNVVFEDRSKRLVYENPGGSKQEDSQKLLHHYVTLDEKEGEIILKSNPERRHIDCHGPSRAGS